MNAETIIEPRKIARALRARVEIDLPPSKSYTQRALIAAALADGESVILNPSPSSDTVTMVGALRQFGVGLSWHGNDLQVRGCGGRFPEGTRTIDVGNAGTCMRFLTALAALAPGTTTLTGDRDMLRRPVLALVEALRGAGVDATCDGLFPPVIVRGGSLSGGTVKLDASLSSQFLSGLLLVAPYATRPLEIVPAGPVSSTPYVAMTIALMRDFGVTCSLSGSAYRPDSTARYSGRVYPVEPDVSSAAFFGAAAAIAGCTVSLPGVRRDTLQGDIAIFPILREMGCRVDISGDGVEISGGTIRGVSIDMNALPDSVPALAVAAAFAASPTTIRNVGHLRHKESDRLLAITTELRRLGASASVTQGDLTIIPGDLRGCDVETYNDHRIAMSFAVAGLRVDGLRIINPGCVKKSFPGFWTELDKFSTG